MPRMKHEPEPEIVKPRPVEVDPEDQPILEDLKDQFGTYKNAVSKSIRGFHRQLAEQREATNASQGN